MHSGYPSSSLFEFGMLNNLKSNSSRSAIYICSEILYVAFLFSLKLSVKAIDYNTKILFFFRFSRYASVMPSTDIFCFVLAVYKRAVISLSL